jgi:hypothetical protein
MILRRLNAKDHTEVSTMTFMIIDAVVYNRNCRHIQSCRRGLVFSFVFDAEYILLRLLRSKFVGCDDRLMLRLLGVNFHQSVAEP